MQAPFPLFWALNVPYRIIELLHTNRHRELLSDRPDVQVVSGTLKALKILDFSVLSFFVLKQFPNGIRIIPDVKEKLIPC